MNGSSSLPPLLGSKLVRFRRRVWLIKMTEGLLAAVFGLAVSYLCVLGLDRVLETPAWLRGILLAAGAAVPGLGLPLKWHHWVWRQRRLEDAARMLRWRFPRLSDRLLGIVELARQDSVAGRSERLVEAAMAQAEESVKDLDFSDAVPRASHRRWCVAALAAGLLVAAGFVIVNEAARNALVRWLMPWQDTERFTYTNIEQLPNPLVVPQSESFTLPVDLREDSRWTPPSATARLSGQDRLSAGREGSTYALNFPPQQEDATVSLKVGDVRESVRLEPRQRPELTAL
ncbi:MAG: hypothetical protein GWO24_13725, partial [Akkermansiaceae bacterium]|nr:hypothetical protein [Akkermansiaceae bacterium]